MSESLLCYRAGPTAIERLRQGTLRDQLRVFVGPATGPKWIVLYGLDRALLELGILGRAGGPVLAGASAGAWRAVALASPDPAKTHTALLEAYTARSFCRGATRGEVSTAYAEILERIFAGTEPFIAGASTHELVIHTARLRTTRPQTPRVWDAATLGVAALLSPLAGAAQRLTLQRVSFCTAGARAVLAGRHGKTVALTAENLLPATLASGTVPMAMRAVHGIPGGRSGAHLDGGLTDYHYADGYTHTDGVTLLMSHQPRIYERWLDQYAPWRRPRAQLLDRLVHVYPSEAFLARLPGRHIPSRQDFTRFADDPESRIAHWRRTADESRALGDQLVSDLESGRFLDRVAPFESNGSRSR